MDKNKTLTVFAMDDGKVTGEKVYRDLSLPFRLVNWCFGSAKVLAEKIWYIENAGEEQLSETYLKIRKDREVEGKAHSMSIGDFVVVQDEDGKGEAYCLKCVRVGYERVSESFLKKLVAEGI